MGAEKTFADYTKTDRADLIDMIEKRGIREGDVVCVRAVGDFGTGAESKRIQDKIAAMGVKIEVIPGKDAKRLPHRPPKVEFDTIQEWQRSFDLWTSPYPEPEALARIGAIAGGEVDQNWANYRFGPRSGKAYKDKRKAMVDRLDRQKT